VLWAYAGFGVHPIRDGACIGNWLIDIDAWQFYPGKLHEAVIAAAYAEEIGDE
jgi:hypothetical protein